MPVVTCAGSSPAAEANPVFTKLRGVAPDRLDATIAAFTDEDWNVLECGYLDVIAVDLAELFAAHFGICEGVGAADLFCRLYQHFLARTTEV
jgi:hypothetical protein